MEKFTYEDLINLEQEGLARVREEDSQGAIPFFEKLIELDPSFEYGAAFESLAYCYEEVGRIEEAGKFFLKALEYEIDEMRLGSYAGFLYEHGTLPEAYEAYLTTYYHDLAMGMGSAQWAESHFECLTEIGTKLGKSSKDIEVDLKEHKPALYRLYKPSDLSE